MFLAIELLLCDLYVGGVCCGAACEAEMDEPLHFVNVLQYAGFKNRACGK